MEQLEEKSAFILQPSLHPCERWYLLPRNKSIWICAETLNSGVQGQLRALQKYTSRLQGVFDHNLKLLDERDMELRQHEGELQEAQQQRMLLRDQLQTLKQQLTSSKQGRPSFHVAQVTAHKQYVNCPVWLKRVNLAISDSSPGQSDIVRSKFSMSTYFREIENMAETPIRPTAALMPKMCPPELQKAVAETRNLQAANKTLSAALDAKEAKMQSDAEQLVQHARIEHDRDKASLVMQHPQLIPCTRTWSKRSEYPVSTLHLSLTVNLWSTLIKKRVVPLSPREAVGWWFVAGTSLTPIWAAGKATGWKAADKQAEDAA